MKLFGRKEDESQTTSKEQGKNLLANLKAGVKTRAFRAGGYSLVSIAVVLAIAIVINLLVGALPASMTQFDTSFNQIFNISSQTKQVIGELDKNVELYWITQTGEEDAYLEKVLAIYDEMSDRLTVTKKDPDVYPTFVAQYYDGTVYNNSVIAVCGDKYRYVENAEIYVYDMTNYWSTGQYDITFDAEGALTSAIAYVTAERLPVLYTLSGHGESELTGTFQAAVKKQNYTVRSVSLLTAGSVPADADAVVINNPQSDISAEEKKMLTDYLSAGGSLFVAASPLGDGTLSRPVLEELMKEYGIQMQSGMVVEANTDHFYYTNPLWLLPDIGTHTITDPMAGKYNVMLPTAQAMTVAENVASTLTVTQLLTTTAESYAVIQDDSRDSYEKQASDASGPFAVAIASEDSATQARVVCVSSAALLDETSDTYVSGGNQDFFLNAMGWICEYEESISIHARSMDYNYLTITNSDATSLTILMVGIIPVCYLLIGIIVFIRRKMK